MARSRAVAPVVAACTLVAVTVLLAVGIGTAALAVQLPSEPASASIALAADADSDRIALVHRGGAALNVSRLSVTVTVGGDPLARQPPVPFFAAHGFRSGPTGPFNGAASDRWTAGERATLRLASTNEPLIDPGDEVTVRLARDETTVAVATARAT
ncbi:type IV pilin [Halomicrobium salinisoli]|uniref:type IV pilin n=1 Tax=Halomicrobium salinisoli TaxID=2878391 RepID=UPI001CF034C0|nr:type IV pilin N-terminal domain-containing protein [Halomicrobium salinisoli]